MVDVRCMQPWSWVLIILCLQDDNSIFTALVQNTGAQAAGRLRAMAAGAAVQAQAELAAQSQPTTSDTASAPASRASQASHSGAAASARNSGHSAHDAAAGADGDTAVPSSSPVEAQRDCRGADLGAFIDEAAPHASMGNRSAMLSSQRSVAEDEARHASVRVSMDASMSVDDMQLGLPPLGALDAPEDIADKAAEAEQEVAAQRGQHSEEQAHRLSARRSVERKR